MADISVLALKKPDQLILHESIKIPPKHCIVQRFPKSIRGQIQLTKDHNPAQKFLADV